jgi:hypothetical protein
MTLAFDLTRLSDRMLNLLTTGAVEQTDPSPVVGAVRTALLQEQLRRVREEPYKPINLDLPCLTINYVRHAYRQLTADVAALETAAALAGDAEQTELLTAAEFLTSVSENLLTAATGGIS